MRIVFFGTPTYCLPVLNKIQKKFKEKPYDVPIVAVVTQKPRPVGRKKFITYSPVDTWAFKRKIPIFHSSEEFLHENIDADLGIVVAYGEILTNEIINYFPYGILNIHPSLLPKYRGASPLQATIVSGDKETGVTVMKIDEKMDHGLIVNQFKEDIDPTDTAKSLGDRLFEKSAQVLVDLIPAYQKRKINLKKQDDTKAIYTSLLKKDDGFVPPKILKAILEGKTFKKDWKINFIKDYSVKPTPEVLERFVRAMTPWPGAWTEVFTDSKKHEEKRLKILEAKLEKGKFEPVKVQLEGKLEVSWNEFKNGYPDFSF